MVAFIDQHRDTYGVEPIGAQVPIAPSTYFLHKAQQRDPDRRCERERQDEADRVWDEHQQVYGPKKVWKQRRREGYAIARCTVVRLMRELGLHGAARGRAWTTATQGGADPRPADLVARRFTPPRARTSSGCRTSPTSPRG